MSKSHRPHRQLIALTGAVVLGACQAQAPAASGEALQDDVGAAHAIAVPRQRVVSLIPGMTETVVALGGEGRLVARTRYDLQPQLADLPSLGGGLDPSLEALVDLNPDLVILWPDPGGDGTLSSRLREIGLPYYAARVGTIADFERHARNLGQLLGLQERAESLVSSVQTELAGVESAVSGAPKVSVYWVVQEDPPMTVGPGTFLDSLIRVAGGANVFEDASNPWPAVSLEEVFWRDPDVVIVPTAGGDDGVRERLKTAAGWSAVAAVQDGSVITVEADLFGRPGPRMGEAAATLARLLHPDLSPGPPSARE